MTLLDSKSTVSGVSAVFIHFNVAVCGRGGGSNNHPGNESFRELVNEVKLPYVNCPKREKPLIARRIVEAVRNQTPPGRFLSKDSKTALWNDIGDGKAREKTSQALREGEFAVIQSIWGTFFAFPGHFFCLPMDDGSQN